MAPALRVLTFPLLALTLASLGRGWYLQTRGHFGTPWRSGSRLVLIASTALASVLWSLRFAGLLGGGGI